MLVPLLVPGLEFGPHVLHGPARAALDPLLNLSAKALQLGGAEFFAILQNPESVADDLTGADVTALLNLSLDELLEMLADDIARRHGDLPMARR